MAKGVHGQAGPNRSEAVLAAANAVVVQQGMLVQPIGQGRRRQAQGVAVHVHKHGLSTTVGNGVASGYTSQRLGDHQVALPHPGQAQRHMQGCRAIDHGHRSWACGVGGHVALKPVYKYPHAGDKGGVNGLVHIGPLLSSEQGLVQGNGALAAVMRADKA